LSKVPLSNYGEFINVFWCFTLDEGIILKKGFKVFHQDDSSFDFSYESSQLQNSMKIRG